jgi:hypothetical protein
MTIRERCIDRRATMQTSRMNHEDIAWLARPGNNIISIGVAFALRLDIEQSRQARLRLITMKRLRRIVGIPERRAVVPGAAMRAANNLKRVLLGNGFEADPRIAPVITGPWQIRRVLILR